MVRWPPEQKDPAEHSMGGGLQAGPDALLDDERPGFEAAKFVLSPPLRDKSNWKSLWQGLAAGTLQAISTDHCPWNFATDKQRGRNDFTQIPSGAPGIETRMPLI